MLGDDNKLFVFKSLFTKPSNVLPLHLKQTFLSIIRIFTAFVGDGIESRLPFKIFSTFKKNRRFCLCVKYVIFKKKTAWYITPKLSHFLYLKKFNHQGVVSNNGSFYSQFYSFNLPFSSFQINWVLRACRTVYGS